MPHPMHSLFLFSIFSKILTGIVLSENNVFDRRPCIDKCIGYDCLAGLYGPSQVRRSQRSLHAFFKLRSLETHASLSLVTRILHRSMTQAMSFSQGLRFLVVSYNAKHSTTYIIAKQVCSDGIQDIVVCMHNSV